MARTKAQKAAARREWERKFKAEHGVSSGTYYAMRRKAKDRGISNRAFDTAARSKSYSAAKTATQKAIDFVSRGFDPDPIFQDFSNAGYDDIASGYSYWRDEGYNPDDDPPNGFDSWNEFFRDLAAALNDMGYDRDDIDEFFATMSPGGSEK